MLLDAPAGKASPPAKLLPSDRPDGADRTPSKDEIAVIREAILTKLTYAIGKDPHAARGHDWFAATALAVRDRIVDRWMDSTRATYQSGRKRVYYLSLEFLIGRLLLDCVSNLGLTPAVRAALAELGVDFDALRTVESDAALGNGGLGRLAACFMDSMASLEIPAYGYGIRYDYGLFRQVLNEGWQHELPEEWLAAGNPWEFERPEVVYRIDFGGTVELAPNPDGTLRHIWHPSETVLAAAYDTPVVGWRGCHVNTLRLWSARAADPLKLETFNMGDYVGALAHRMRAEAISRILYPSDVTPAGQELRLRQEFFFTSASLQDLVRRHLDQHGDLGTLPDHAALQLNDTHPAIAVAELMRLLVDEHQVPWEKAWRITTGTLNYTNHTLLPEALERWPVSMMERLLPRHMQLIYLINWLHLEQLAERGPLSEAGIQAVSLIDESQGRFVRMGHLAFLGSHRVNGVSALHTDLMRKTVFRDLHALYPDRIVNKTNGVTFRRWLHQANPLLRDLLVETIGERVLDDPDALTQLERVAGDVDFQDRFAAQRRANKETLAAIIRQRVQIEVDPAALFDVQIKRIHEYKRQLLNVLEAIALYNAIKAEPNREWVPRVKIFAGKAAASYRQAKLIIKLANDVARIVNDDPAVRGRLKVVFLPNYNVSLAEAIIPAADLSEQISTAGMEASGTGNMKLALNGALTIGTLDGANIEICERVGHKNMFIFGLTAEEVEARWRSGSHAPITIASSPRLAQALDDVAAGVFSPEEPQRFAPLIEELSHRDRFMVTADFDAYWEAQRAVDRCWRERKAWWHASILNTAHVAWFSSDRTIREYADEVWNVTVPEADR
ncbi:MAG TPA: glycogen/starch/alpha-glucan phosphorylase [Beijerinckiaceae bacterium]|jgi:starch phosphorylase